MAKDKRVKGCYNLTCKNYRKEVKFKVTDNFCPNCGKKLVFVCADCFEKIESTDSEARLCKACEDKHTAKREKLKAGVDKAKDLAGKGVKAAPAVLSFAKDPKVVNAVKKGASVLIKKK